jgi:hypothetical protein
VSVLAAVLARNGSELSAPLLRNMDGARDIARVLVSRICCRMLDGVQNLRMGFLPGIALLRSRGGRDEYLSLAAQALHAKRLHSNNQR